MTENANESSTKAFMPLGLIACLIVYGSLYPFSFSSAPKDSLSQLFSNWHLSTSLGDLLGNIGLFIPWGLSGMSALAPRWGPRNAITATALIGFGIALAVQILQIWTPSRDPALADVFWNFVGIGIGTVAWWTYKAVGLNVQSRRETVPAMPIILLGGFILVEWLPLVPSIDLQLLKEQLKLLWVAPTQSPVEISQRCAMALMAGHLLGILLGRATSIVLLPLLLTAVVVGKLFFVGAAMDSSVPIGFALAVLGWWGLAKLSHRNQRTALWLLLLMSYSVGSLAPFDLRDEPSAISWLPFAAMLEGSMLSNVRSVAGSMVVFAGILFVGVSTANRYVIASWGLALWVVLMELLQTAVKTRVSDMTEPLLALLLGHLLARTTPVLAYSNGVATRSFPTPTPTVAPRFGIKWLVLQTTIAVTLLTLLMAVILKLPGIPYNVKELFRADGNVLALGSVALALLWAGAGSVFLGTRIARARWPGLLLPPLALLVSLLSLTFLWMGVTTESIEDISGSSNTFWWVTNRNTWGTFWQQAFLYLDSPNVIGFIEHCVRYSALYAPLPIFLGSMIAAREASVGGVGGLKGAVRLSGLVFSTLATLLACKVIAFDWTSTDNLNELIARDGEWGWGGGGFLYSLLLLFCFNSMLLAAAVGTRWRVWVPRLLFSLAVVPLGWWLLNQGLEQHVEKYNLVYSGVQFLLGETRSTLLSPYLLFMRWCAVQIGAVLTLAAGVWLGQAAFSSLRQVQPRTVKTQ